MSDERTRANRDWANYRRFVHHKNALNMIFNYRPAPAKMGGGPGPSFEEIYGCTLTEMLNADIQYDVERAADEEGVNVADYLKGPSHE